MIHNISRQTVISNKPIYAKSLLDRCRGMIGRHFQDFDGIVFEHCNTIHTLFVTTKLDVIFVDDQYKICSLHRSLPRWLPIVKCKKASAVIELPLGTIDRSKCETGDIVTISTETTELPSKGLLHREVLNSTETIIPFSKDK